MGTSPSLSTRAARGVLWTGGAAALQLGSILVLYRFLAIQDMGRFEYALILVMFLALVSNLGLNAALVQHRDVDTHHFSAAFWVNLALGVGFCGVLQLSAPLLGRLLGGQEPADFSRALRILALLLPCAATSGVFRARLQRALNFAAVARAELLSVVIFALYIIPLVLYCPHLGVLIPLSGAVLREAGLLVGLAWGARWLPQLRCSPEAVRCLLPFALNFTGSRLVAYLNSNIASLCIFPMLGSTAQGYYRLAERLTITPLVRLSTTITHVSLPTFSSIQDDDSRLARGYLMGVQSLIFFLGPLLAALIVFAPEVLALLNRLPALPVLRLLAAATMLRAMGTMVGSAFMAKGRADWLLRWSIFSLAVLLPALLWAVSHGIATVAWVIACTSLLFLVVSQILVNRLLALKNSVYLGALGRPLAVAIGVWGCCAGLRPVLQGSALTILIQGALIATLATALGVRLFAWKWVATHYRGLRDTNGSD